MRKWITIAGVAWLVFGLACLNYTKASGWEHHTTVARQNHWPEPSDGILLGGVAAVSLGSAMIGYSLGARVRPSTGIAVSVPTSGKSG
jgi:hypothetical protein